MKRSAALLLLTAIACTCSDVPKAGRWNGSETRARRVEISSPVQGEIASAADFAVLGSGLYLLDWRDRKVVRLQQRPAAYVATAIFSRPGNGPGELSEPVAIDADEQTGYIGVLERSGELELFDSLGIYLGTESLDLPCSAGRIQLSMFGTQRLIAERCFGGRFIGQSADTTYMFVALVAAGHTPKLLKSRAVSNAKGTWGSIYVATWPFSRSVDRIAFGTGLDACIFEGSVGTTTELTERCEIPFTRYSAPKPRQFERNDVTKASSWPEPLPLFAAMVHVGNSLAVVRLVTADSAAFEAIDAPGSYFMVGPLDTLVGCKPAGCLWYDEASETPKVRFVSQRELQAARNRHNGDG